MTNVSDGSTASYYELPKGCTELQDLISYRNLNAQDGEIFRAIYRKGRASHSDELRDAKKVLFYAKAEVARLEALHHAPIVNNPSRVALYTEAEEARMDVVGQNGNDGEHYDDDDGWIEWHGGECPVGWNMEVDYRMRCESAGEYSKASGKSLRWSHRSHPGDIAHYRIAKDATPCKN
ncbi:MAG: hypothetical protein ACREBG_10745 [Pyrinomonadaceae bacterium]